ncbi:proline transporter [Lophiostoma macrostomum CBS 122681]|uniref:Proline transporter n=1 Tax=Lophiostoma macrostomum CBS 122681 TaxID=1314788 RepID=A0A6A6SK69_9PLEO|nr:proline transporter [Lophiostoma macrostomum CBS 122681]
MGVEASTKAPHEAIDATSGVGIVDSVQHGTHRGLKPRHGQMIAFGGAVGTGLFVSTGAVLAMGGPAFILVCYLWMAFMMYLVITSLVEIATLLPAQGVSVSYYGTQMVSKSLGFALGYLYIYSLGILVPYEITAGALIIEYWGSPVPTAVWITIFIFAIVGLNLLPVSMYGESEFWFSFIKLVTMIGLIILTIVLFFGGGPEADGVLGFHYWKDPGATTTWIVNGPIGYLVAFTGVMVYSAFPFTFSPELVIYASGEMANPRKDLPVAAKRYILRLFFFYVGTVLAIGIICPYNASDLTNGGAGAKSSPFVVGIQKAGIRGLGSVINAVILMSAWSAGNAFLYMASRGLYSMAVAGQAPAVFKRCNKQGNPYVAVCTIGLFGPLAYMNVGTDSSTVFNWFISMINTTGFISWVCVSIIYLRFRKAWNAQGRPPLPYKRNVQPWGAWVTGIFFTALTLLNGFNVFLKGQWSTATFITTYIGLPAFIVLYLAHKFVACRNDPWAYPVGEINLQSPDEALTEYDTGVDEESASKNIWGRFAAKLK